MPDLFDKTLRGSILLWNVQDESELPKRKELIRLVGADNFIYYKSHGHHSDYIRALARLKDCLNPDPAEEHQYYGARTKTSHFLFTELEIEHNSFFLLRFTNVCLGSYFVGKEDIVELNKLLARHDQVCRFIEEINDWPRRIESHQEDIKKYNIVDPVIENFDIAKLRAISFGYGQQAKDHALANLEAWHERNYWKSKPKQQPAQQEDQQQSSDKDAVTS